jgi:serine/threonine protein kinase
LQASGIVIDFRRIRRISLGLGPLSEYEFDLSRFSEESVLNTSGSISTKTYRGCDDGFQIVVKSIGRFKSVESSQIEREMENLVNLRHPCIAGPMGFVLPFQAQAQPGDSLSKVLSVSSEWRTPTAKEKAIVGLVLSLSFGHSLGLVHGHLTESNVILNENKVIQITDFCMNGLREQDGECSGMVSVGGLSEAGRNPMAGIRGFVRFLSEIVIGDSRAEGVQALGVPRFVSWIIERGISGDHIRANSFVKIFEILREHRCEIVPGVDSDAIF